MLIQAWDDYRSAKQSLLEVIEAREQAANEVARLEGDIERLERDLINGTAETVGELWAQLGLLRDKAAQSGGLVDVELVDRLIAGVGVLAGSLTK